jgi:Zinc carboxypeptidase
MKCGMVLALVTVLLPVLTATAARAQLLDPPSPPPDHLELYHVTGPPGLGATLTEQGYDVAARRVDGPQELVDVVLTGRQLTKVRAAGFLARAVLPARGDTARQDREDTGSPATDVHSGGDTVWRSYGQRGGLADQLRAVAARHPAITKLQSIGSSGRGAPILALKVTKDARTTRDGSRPAVLYSSLRDGREWVGGQLTMRLLEHVTEGHAGDPALRHLLAETELWFVPVANPDGYDHTFTAGNRLWSKNLRGVDLTHNFPTAFGHDDEGSSADPESQNYRGPGPASEPETRAFDGLLRRIGFVFAVDYRAYGERLLYPVGWQTHTPTADDPVYQALSGSDESPAIPGYDVGRTADTGITNGDPADHAHAAHGTLAWTVELGEGCGGCGFAFPDDEDLVQEEFRKNLPFALDLARSATSPARPVSHLPTTTATSTPDLVVDEFPVSYGTTQQVEVTARRTLGPVALHVQVGQAPERVVRTKRWEGGRRYGHGYDRYFHRLRGTVTGVRPGDVVKVWFRATNGSAASKPFTYRVNPDIGGRVLVLAAEDVTGTMPTQQRRTASYAQTYADALAAAGYPSDVYDVDAAGRTEPHPLGVLSHYRTVVWETGDDVVPRVPGQPSGTASRLALEIELSVRDYLNEGGKLVYAGSYAGFGDAQNGAFYFSPGRKACQQRAEPCLPLVDDFLQYYLGAYRYVDDGGSGPTGAFPVRGVAGRFQGLRATFRRSDHTAALMAAPGVSPPRKVAAFPSAAPLRWDPPTGQRFTPRTGAWYLAADRTPASYRRLTRTIDLRRHSRAELTFGASYDVEDDWDYLFVEARTVGREDWTTLPAAGGRTSQSTGRSCAARWDRLHPGLRRYQGAGCLPQGTTGRWHAATGDSRGWQTWTVDLSRYAGRRVEVSISYASDETTEGLGVFLDDVSVVADGMTLARTSFEAGLDGWRARGWARSRERYQEGAGVVTATTVYLGFGVEALSSPEMRVGVLRSALRHLHG